MVIIERTIKLNYCDNYKTGNLGEFAVQSAFRKLGYLVRNHNAWDDGVDLSAIKKDATVRGEVLNWPCGGYIHNQRFMDIVRILKSSPAKEYWLFAFGVCPIQRQRRLSSAMGIKLCHFEDSIKKVSKTIVDAIVTILNPFTVITSGIVLGVSGVLWFFVFGLVGFFEWWRGFGRFWRGWLGRFAHSFLSFCSGSNGGLGD